MLAILGCAPQTCSNRDDDAIAAQAEALVGEPGRLADEAEALLVARGRDSIAILETAIYNASEPGRRRVVRALTRIGHPEVLPILRKLAEADEAASVRQAARDGLARLAARKH